MTAETEPALHVQRDKVGRWLPGASANPKGRLPAQSLTAVLRSRADPDKLAAMLLAKAAKGDLAAIIYVYDRLEGRPMQSTEIHGPRDEAYLEVLERVRLAVERRALVLRGELLEAGEPTEPGEESR